MMNLFTGYVSYTMDKTIGAGGALFYGVVLLFGSISILILYMDYEINKMNLLDRNEVITEMFERYTNLGVD